MRAIVTKQFKGRPDDEFDTRTLSEGEIITGDLAEVAVREGWARAQLSELGSDSGEEGGVNHTEADGAGDVPTDEFDGLKKADLLKIAEAEGVAVDHGMTKAVLVEAILRARAAKEA